MCHFDSSLGELRYDVVHRQLGEVLAMTLGPPVLLFPLELEDDYLFTATFAADSGNHFGVAKFRARKQLAVGILRRQQTGKLNNRTYFRARYGFHAQDLALRDTILLAACFNDCVHKFL
jgi:hypothetical protein